MKVQKLNHPSCKIAVCGVSGSGKTTFFVKLLKQQKAKWTFVYDHQGELAGRLGGRAVTTLDGLIKATARGGLVIFDPSELFKADFGQGFLFFADFVAEFSEKHAGRKLVVVDELQELAFRDNPEELMVLLNVGRRRQIDLFFICQSPNQLHNLVRNQITEFYTFLQGDKNATEYFEEQGYDREKILKLPPFHWLYKNTRTGRFNEGGGKV